MAKKKKKTGIAADEPQLEIPFVPPEIEENELPEFPMDENDFDGLDEELGEYEDPSADLDEPESVDDLLAQIEPMEADDDDGLQERLNALREDRVASSVPAVPAGAKVLPEDAERLAQPVPQRGNLAASAAVPRSALPSRGLRPGPERPAVTTVSAGTSEAPRAPELTESRVRRLIAEALQHRAAISDNQRLINTLLDENRDLRAQLSSVQGKRDSSLLKGAPPAKFSGDNKLNIKLWLDSMALYFTAAGADELQRTAVAATYLEGPAAKFWVNYVAAHPDPSWETFCSVMRSAFGHVDPEQVARAKLAKLVQTGTVDVYIRQFLSLCAEIVEQPLSVGDKIDKFRNGLNPVMRSKCAHAPLGGKWLNFAELVSYAGIVGTQLEVLRDTGMMDEVGRAFTAKKRSFADVAKTDLTSKAKYGRPSDGAGPSKANRPSSSKIPDRAGVKIAGPSPDKDKLKAPPDQSPPGKRGSPEWAAFCWANGRCLKCGRPGHRKQDCGVKKPLN